MGEVDVEGHHSQPPMLQKPDFSHTHLQLGFWCDLCFSFCKIQNTEKGQRPCQLCFFCSRKHSVTVIGRASPISVVSLGAFGHWLCGCREAVYRASGCCWCGPSRSMWILKANGWHSPLLQGEDRRSRHSAGSVLW